MRKLIKFTTDYAVYVAKGGPKYYSWMAFLGVFVLFWLYGNYMQLSEGMIITGLTDQVSWGLYLANFVFLVGVAAGAVTVVFPAYVYKHKALHEVAVLSEMLAIAAVVMCLLFVLNHMGRPERIWHMIPYIGIFNWPNSMLDWDVLVLSVYLLLNVVGGFYFLYKKYGSQELNKGFYMSIIYIAIVWALSIHTVTAFLINTMPARPMWHTGMMPIRFIITAFAAGPSLIILVFLTIRSNTKLWIKDEAIDMLSTIVVWCLGIALFLTLSEIVTELYHPTEHSAGLSYLMFGYNGLNNLVPWFWSSLIMMIAAFIMLLIPRIRKDYGKLQIAVVLAFIGIWIEKGMGLMIPGSIPSPIGEFTQYTPSLLEVFNSLGNWAIGFIVLTILLKGAIGILLGDVKYANG
ncbi:MAG: polysulfide reductase NrfD [Gammaproteobacteria bacterium]|nr:MAG: polysulfide reductase NrfD [Gammaproteobacteria bacterium]